MTRHLSAARGKKEQNLKSIKGPPFLMSIFSFGEELKSETVIEGGRGNSMFNEIDFNLTFD